ncbi:MAG: metallophosphoesterase, partial [Nitrospirae bacterium]|nr:metallophosphoesterase [Nitrospirota bacterium]
MKKVAIFMSDFHLGQKDRMEEFHAEQEFAELINRFSIEYAVDPEKGKEADEVDLVLLGDVMDLWTTITYGEEVNAQTADEVELYFPVTEANKPDAVQKELAKVRAVMREHHLFFDTLARFLVDDPTRRRVIYIPGNHDHSVVDSTIQGEIHQRILRGCRQMMEQQWVRFEPEVAEPRLHDLAQRIVFPNWYADALLQVYAEHGNQLTHGGAYRYNHFDQFGEECPGYYELKLVWNRLERRTPELDNVFMGALSPAMWP